MNQPKPFSQNKIVFTLLSMGLVGGLIGLIIGVANGSGLLGLLIGILLTVFKALQEFPLIKMKIPFVTPYVLFCIGGFLFFGVVGIILGLLVGWFWGGTYTGFIWADIEQNFSLISLLARSCGTMFLELSVGLSSFSSLCQF